MEIKEIFKNNEDWVAEKLNLDANYFNDLSKGQNPDIFYIGCSDSRVAAEELMGVHAGDVFVYRNIANLVPNTDISILSAIAYAVKHLKVDHIIVCGHYYCGGIKAAMEANDLGILNAWLRDIRDVYRLHKDELNQITDEDKRYKRLVELNVKEQCINVIKTSSVQRESKERKIEVHGWVFDIRSGKLIDLNIDFDEVMKNVMKIYRLK